MSDAFREGKVGGVSVRTLHQLTYRQENVFRLAQEHTVQEIAALTGLAPSSIYKMARKAGDRLGMRIEFPKRRQSYRKFPGWHLHLVYYLAVGYKITRAAAKCERSERAALYALSGLRKMFQCDSTAQLVAKLYQLGVMPTNPDGSPRPFGSQW